MRFLLLTPLAYIAGIDGFSWFVPYLGLVGLIVGVARIVKSARRGFAGAQVGLSEDVLELELAPA
jgi:hypothetical protein